MRAHAGLLLLSLPLLACDAASLELADPRPEPTPPGPPAPADAEPTGSRLPTPSEPAPGPEPTPPILMVRTPGEPALHAVDLERPDRRVRVGLDDPSVYGLGPRVRIERYTWQPLRFEVGDGERWVLFERTPEGRNVPVRARDFDSALRWPSEDGQYETWLDADGAHVRALAPQATTQTFDLPVDRRLFFPVLPLLGHRWAVILGETTQLGVWLIEVDRPPRRVGGIEDPQAWVRAGRRMVFTSQARSSGSTLCTFTDTGVHRERSFPGWASVLAVFEHTLALSMEDGTIALFDAADGAMSTLEGYSLLSSGQDWESRFIVARRAADTWQLRVIDLSTGAEVPGPPITGEVIGSGEDPHTMVVLEGQSGGVDVRNLEDGTTVAWWPIESSLYSAALSPNGRWLTLRDEDPLARAPTSVMDLRTGDSFPIEDGPTGFAGNLAFLHEETVDSTLEVAGLGVPRQRIPLDAQGHLERFQMSAPDLDLFRDAAGTFSLVRSAGERVEVLWQVAAPGPDPYLVSGDVVWLSEPTDDGWRFTAFDARYPAVEAQTVHVAPRPWPTAWPARSSLVSQDEEGWVELLPDGTARRLTEISSTAVIEHVEPAGGLWVRDGQQLLRLPVDGSSSARFTLPVAGWLSLDVQGRFGFGRQRTGEWTAMSFDIEEPGRVRELPEEAIRAWRDLQGDSIYTRHFDQQGRLLAVTEAGLVAIDGFGDIETLVPGPLPDRVEVNAFNGPWTLFSDHDVWIEREGTPLHLHVDAYVAWAIWHDAEHIAFATLNDYYLLNVAEQTTRQVPRNIWLPRQRLDDGRWLMYQSSAPMVWDPEHDTTYPLLPSLPPDRASIVRILE